MSTSSQLKFHPGLSIDCVLLGFHENQLKVLLLKMKNLDQWALPGGFVNHDMDIDKAALNVLKERTGLDNIFLRQFYVFGDVARNKENLADFLMHRGVISKEMHTWFEQRFVTVGYYALIEYEKVKKPKPDMVSEKCEWHALETLPELYLDHSKIIDKALETVKLELNYQPIGLNLLPDQFSMPELQALYETVLGKKLDRRNFRRKILGYDILIATNKKRKGGKYRSPLLYEFDREKYKKAMEAGLNSGW